MPSKPGAESLHVLSAALSSSLLRGLAMRACCSASSRGQLLKNSSLSRTLSDSLGDALL